MFDSAPELLTYLRETGYTVVRTTARGCEDDVQVLPASQLTEPLRVALLKHRERLVRLLKIESAGAKI